MTVDQLQRWIRLINAILDQSVSKRRLETDPGKTGKSAEVDNIPAELVQAGEENMIDVLTEMVSEEQENDLPYTS